MTQTQAPTIRGHRMRQEVQCAVGLAQQTRGRDFFRTAKRHNTLSAGSTRNPQQDK